MAVTVILFPLSLSKLLKVDNFQLSEIFRDHDNSDGKNRADDPPPRAELRSKETNSRKHKWLKKNRNMWDFRKITQYSFHWPIFYVPASSTHGCRFTLRCRQDHFICLLAPPFNASSQLHKTLVLKIQFFFFFDFATVFNRAQEVKQLCEAGSLLWLGQPAWDFGIQSTPPPLTIFFIDSHSAFIDDFPEPWYYSEIANGLQSKIHNMIYSVAGVSSL